MACTRTRSAPGVTPVACATTGSIRGAIDDTGSATSSGSSPPPRSTPSTADEHGMTSAWPAAATTTRTGPVAAVAGALRVGQVRAPADPLESERHALDLEVVDRLTRLAGRGDDLDDDLASAVSIIRDGYDHRLVVVWRLRDGRLIPRVDAHAPGAGPARLVDVPMGYGLLGAALDAGGREVATTSARPSPLGATSGARTEHAAAIPGADGPWGVLHIVPDSGWSAGGHDPGALSLLAVCLGTLIAVADRREEAQSAAPPCRGIAPRGQRHRQPPGPRRDHVGPGGPRDGPVRGRPSRRLPASSGWARGGRDQPRPVGSLSGQCPRPAGPVAAGRRHRRRAAALRHRLPRGPARTGRPGGRRPGGVRYRLRGPAPRRPRDPGVHRDPSRSAARLDPGRTPDRGRPGRPGRASRSGRPRTSSGWRRGPPSCSPSSSWVPA